MRVYLLKDKTANTFSKQLLNLGDVKIPCDSAGFCQMQTSIQDLMRKVFPNISENYKNHDWLYERAILAPKIEDVNKNNEQIQSKLPGAVTKYTSIDSVTIEDQAVDYPVEFLNSIEQPGMPPHILHLKVGSPLMIMRNLNPPKICNGTRVLVKNLHQISSRQQFSAVNSKANI